MYVCLCVCSAALEVLGASVGLCVVSVATLVLIAFAIVVVTIVEVSCGMTDCNSIKMLAV